MGTVFSNLILDVGDLDRSLEFYHGMLRLPVVKRENCDGHRLATLSTGSTEILLLQQPAIDQNPALDRAGGQVIKFTVRNLPGIAADLAQERVKVLQPLDMAQVGERTILIADPDGYPVLLSEPVETLN